MNEWCFIITGQVRGGKNNMVVTRSGHHFPRASWAKWRDAAVREVKAQLPAGWRPIDEPVNVMLNYVAGDKRRRDFPAICDAVWHVLEKAGVVTDDTYLWPAHSIRSYDKAAPKITIYSTSTPTIGEVRAVDAPCPKTTFWAGYLWDVVNGELVNKRPISRL